MIKRAVILHGTNGSPSELKWQVWLRELLESSGYEVFFPQLPDCDKPDLQKYDTFLQASGWDFTDNVIVGHSSGATTLLHLLQQEWFPHIRSAVLVGTFMNERLLSAASWYESGQFDELFTEGFDIEVIKQHSDKFYFVHGDDDPYCDYGDAKNLNDNLNGEFLTIKGGGHIASSANIDTLPSLESVLRRDGLLD